MTVETLAAASETAQTWIPMRLPLDAAAETSGIVSEATIKSHVRHLFAKLDVRNRVQAVVLPAKLVWSAQTPAVPVMDRSVAMTDRAPARHRDRSIPGRLR